MKKKMFSVILAILILAGFHTVAAYAAENVNPVTALNSSQFITDTTVDDAWEWKSGSTLPVGAVITNDTATDLEIIYVAERVSSLPAGANTEVIAPGTSKTLG